VLARLEGCGKSHEWKQIKKYIRESRSTSRPLSLDDQNDENIISPRRKRTKYRSVSRNIELNEDTTQLPKKKKTSDSEKNNERKRSTSTGRKKRSKCRSVSRSIEVKDKIRLKVSKKKKTFDKQKKTKKVKRVKFGNLNLDNIDRPFSKANSIPSLPPSKEAQRIITQYFIVGDRVRMRDQNYSSWINGVVTSVKPIRARFSSDKPSCEGYEWDQIQLKRKPRKVKFLYPDMVKIIPNNDMIKALIANK